MKTTFGGLILAILILAAANLARAQTNDLASLLQQGLLEEQANRNLDAAIADYSALAAQFDKNRQLAATAIFRLGECYRMQNKTNEAAAQYQRLLKDFSDQQTLATLSRQNLAGMGISEASANAHATANGNADVVLWNKLKDLPKPDVEKMLTTLVNDSVLSNLIQQRDEAKAKLATLAVDFAPNNLNYVRQKALFDSLQQQIDERVDGILAGLKLRAEIAGGGAANNLSASTVTTDEESQEIQRIQTMILNSPDLINAVNGGVTPLGNAAAQGWLKVAAYLLDHGADVNAGYGTALLRATKAGNRAMVEFLLSRGADVNKADVANNTPLHVAVQNSFPAVVEVLLANRANVNAQTHAGGYTPLLLAAQNNNPKIVALLLEHKADVNLQDESGRTPLSEAARLNFPEIVKLLLTAGANPNLENKDGRTALSFAAEKNSPEMVKQLLTAKADPNGGKLDAPLLAAIYAKDTNSAELLLQAGADPNAKSAVDWAVGGNVSSVRFVNNPNRYSLTTPLYLATTTKQFPLVQLLLKFKADPNDSQTDNRPLLFSALSDTNILKALLDAGAKVDARDTFSGIGGRIWNWTPLLYAVQNKSDIDSVEILLQHGANPNVRDSNGDTPLHLAAANVPGKNVFQWLLDAKADPNVRNGQGETPLDILKRVSVGNYGNISSEQKVWAGELVGFLRQHGALDKLPDWNAITVSRPAANFSEVVFQKGTNDWNQFTLLEAILNFYGSSRTHSVSQGTGVQIMNSGGDTLPFPDLNHIVIMRPSHDSTNQTRLVINLLNSTNGIDVSKDVPLEFGDVVEISELDHALGARPVGLTDGQSETLFSLFKGNVRLAVHGQTVEIPIYHCFDSGVHAVLGQSEARNLLLASSDLSRVKVIRRDPKTGKSQEWILDCNPPEPSANSMPIITYQWNNTPPSTDLRLRDGDVIEVPEKP